MKVQMMINQNERDIFKQKVDYLKNMVDSRYLIEALGFEISRETGSEIRGVCKIHGGDNRTSFRFNKERKTWVCFSHKCHEEHGNDVIGLVKAVLGFSFVEAVAYLSSLVGDSGFLSVDYTEYTNSKEKLGFIRTQKKDKDSKFNLVDEEYLKHFKGYRSNYFNKKGFDDSTLNFFEVAGGYKDSQGVLRDIIPIRDADGVLVAYSFRDIRDIEDTDFKYILTKSFNKDSVLYNLYNAKNYIINKPLILVEGFKSVWRLYDYGIYNVAAVMGSTITSPGQFNLLFKYNISDMVVILFDNDKAGIDGALKGYKDLSNKTSVTPIFITEVDEKGHGLDPSDLTKNQILTYLQNFI